MAQMGHLGRCPVILVQTHRSKTAITLNAPVPAPRNLVQFGWVQHKQLYLYNSIFVTPFIHIIGQVTRKGLAWMAQNSPPRRRGRATRRPHAGFAQTDVLEDVADVSPIKKSPPLDLEDVGDVFPIKKSPPLNLEDVVDVLPIKKSSPLDLEDFADVFPIKRSPPLDLEDVADVLQFLSPFLFT